MSLYVFGFVHSLRAALPLRIAAAQIEATELEGDDQALLACGGEKVVGDAIRVVDVDGPDDAVNMWNELHAREAAVEKCSLFRAVQTLIESSSAGAVAVTEGGAEHVHEIRDRRHLLDVLSQETKVPWDASPGFVLKWTPKTRRT
jgi:hypothetical protein